MDHIITDSGLEIRDGTIVMLVQFPGTRWVVKHGWYTYQGNQYTGWYFSSIPTQTCLPVTDEYLKMITVVNDNCGCKPPVCPPPFPPCPPPPFPPCPPPNRPHFGEDEQEMLDRTFITVNTLEDRDKLNEKIVPDGKLVRVNSVRGVVKYYSWNLEKRTWEEETFGVGEDVNDLTSRVESIEHDIQWMNINKEVIK